MLYDKGSFNEKGHYCFAGCDTVELARKYGTPLYLLDEEAVRAQCRAYVRAMRAHFREGSMPLYASKANCVKALYPILQEEGMGADVVSCGEMYVALAAGFPAEKLYFHGNAKTMEDVRFAISRRAGCFIVDNPDELQKIERAAGEAGIRQRVLLRVTPGIDPHTFAAVNTGTVECKFGMPILTGQALEFVGQALTLPHVEAVGLHCHIGSQIFDQDPLCMAVDIMTGFMRDVRAEYGFETKVLNLGGGLGVQYVEGQPVCDIEGSIARVAERLRTRCAAYGLEEPSVLMEPGRSIVGAAGITVYTVQSVKCIPGYKDYVAVDGGMADNPRYALYEAPYTLLNASRAGEPDFTCSVVGRCCESGDIIQEDVRMLRPQVGEQVAVLVTGAYNYAMASNYNTLGRPPMVLLRNGTDRLVVRRETFQDMLACQL